VHSGLVAALENEAQLATVLGHEIAHATHRHGYRGFKDTQSKQKWFGLGSMIAGLVVGSQTDSPAAGLITGVGSQLALGAAVSGHGRKLEDEADVVGLYYMVEAGYDYMEAPEVWNVFSKYTKDQSKGRACALQHGPRAVGPGRGPERPGGPRPPRHRGPAGAQCGRALARHRRRLLRAARREAGGRSFENDLKLAPDSPEAPKIRAFLEVLKEG
jgi:hypothetical protein